MATVFPLVFITNPQILTVICCTHPHIQYMLKKPSRILNFLDVGRDFAVTTPIILAKPQRCASAIQEGFLRAQEIDRESALQTSPRRKRKKEFHSPLLFTPNNLAVKNIILKNFKLLQNDPETATIFLQPPLTSYKRGENISNFLVRSALKTDHQRDTFQCARARCKTCPFNLNTDRISGPKRSIQITDRFSCTFPNVIYCITCTFCKKLYGIGETGRRLGDCFREHFRDVEKDDKDASTPVVRCFNLHKILHHTWPSATFHCSMAARKAAKFWNKASFFKSAPSIPTV